MMAPASLMLLALVARTVTLDEAEHAARQQRPDVREAAAATVAGVARVDRVRRLDPVAARHADVHQHDVGGVLLTESNRLVSVFRAADDDEASVLVEDALDQVCEVRVVFGDQDAEGCLVHEGRSLPQYVRRMRQ